MKKKIKKIVSSITSIIVGCSMITATQVSAVAKDGVIVHAYTNADYLDDILLAVRSCPPTDSEFLTIVQDKKESKCMEGMATDGKYIYVAKIKYNNDSNVRIFRYDKDSGDLTILKKGNEEDLGSGHANDMTAVKYNNNTYLFILNGSKIQKYKIDQKKKTLEECGTITIKGESFSGLAAETGPDHSINNNKLGLYLKVANKIYRVEVDMAQKSETIAIEDKEKVKKIIGDWTRKWNGSEEMKNKLKACERQGIAYYGSSTCKILYMVYSDREGENKGDNYIVEYNLNSTGENRILNVHKVTNPNDSNKSFEIESCVIIGQYTYYNTNQTLDKENLDGIYWYLK